MTALVGTSSDSGPAVFGDSAQGEGVRGTAHSPDHGGVVGTNESAGQGVFGESVQGEGVRGMGHSPDHGAVVGGNLSAGQGVFGESAQGEGVRGMGHSPNHGAVVGTNESGPGVVGQSEHEAGVRGTSTHGTGVVGIGGTFAAQFVGTVQAQGDIEITAGHDLILDGADYAEALTADDSDIAAGCVVVLGPDGDVRRCSREYDTAVAGIVSGAGGVKPALVLDRHVGSVNVALMGKVWCLADADPAPIHPGDLLTTSSTVGHSRRVSEPERAFGTVIGKALTQLDRGRGLIRVLVSPR